MIFIFLCVIDIASKYSWVVSLKGKGIAITNAFWKFLFESKGHKPNKIWIDKSSKFCDRSVKSWLQDNVMEMHSICFWLHLIVLDLLEPWRIKSKNI